MKKIILTFIATLLAGLGSVTAQNVATVNGTGYPTLAEALNAAREAAAGGWNTTSVTVEILEDITFASDAEWTPIVYNQLNPITINGNGKTITNLPGMLYAKSGSGVSTLTINDLTFEYPKVSLTTDYAAVIMGYADCVKGLYFNNVHVNNATVTGANYVAGFVGYAAGYSNTNDGPVFQNVEFNNCSVTNSTFTSTGGGSVGALMGHAAGSTDSRIEVEETTVSGNTISTTKASKAGALFGTVGAAGPTGDHPEAGIYVSANVSNNDVTANGTAITSIYGRQGTSTGRLTLTEGGSYDSAPIAAADAENGWATVADGVELTQNSDGSYTVVEPVVKLNDGTTEQSFGNLSEAINSLSDGATITLLQNITLEANVVIGLESGKGFTLIFGDFTITKGNYKVLLPTGVSVTTDKQTNIFGSATAGLNVEEKANSNGTYTYIVINDVYWSWTDGDGRTGYYDYFHSPFDSGNTTGEDEVVELMRNVTMTADITCGRVGGTLCLKFGNYTVNRNGFHVLLPAPRVWEARAMVPSAEGGVTIYTDQITDIFAAAESGYTILVAPSDDPNYAYAYQVVEVDDENAVARNKQTGILYTDLQLAIDQAAAGNTIELLEGIENVTLTKTVNIDKSITIEGGDYQVTSEVTTGALYGPRLDPAFHITGPGSVTLNKMNIVAPYVVPGHDGPGIYDQYTSGSVGIVVDRQFNDSLVINYSTITTTGRGIDVLSVGGGFVLDVKHSTITTTDDDPDTAYGEEVDFDPTTDYINSFAGDPFGRGRGINFGNDAVTCVANIQFSKIQGYAYPINIADNSGKVVLTMIDCSTWGRDVINNWGDHSTINLKNITANGYNNENVEEPAAGDDPVAQNNEAFAAVVDYKGADYNFYNIEGLRVVANVEAADANPTSATENFIDLRGTNATVKISGNSGYEIADDLRDRVGFVNNRLSDDDVEIGESEAFKRMIDKTVNNRVYFDDQAKAYFNYWFEILEPFDYDYDGDGEDEYIRIAIDDEKDHTNLYPVVPLEVNVMLTITPETEDDEEEAKPKVFYFGKLQDAFNSENFASGAKITILADIEMDEDITPNLKRGEDFELSSATNEAGDLFSITQGNYHIFLNPLVTAFYDDFASTGYELFAPTDEDNTTILGEEAVYYTAANVYWAGDVEAIDGMYWLFDELFDYVEDDLNPYFTPGTYTRLEMDLKLDRDLKLPTGEGMGEIEEDDPTAVDPGTTPVDDDDTEEIQQYWLDFNDYTIEKGDYSIILKLGQEVYTTATTDIFSSFSPEYTVVFDIVDESKDDENGEAVAFGFKYYLMKDGLAVIVDPATFCGHRQEPTFIVKKKTTEEVSDGTTTTTQDKWVVLENSLTKEEYDEKIAAGEDVSGYDYYWYLVPPADEQDDSTYIYAKTYVQALVIEGISFQGTRKADFVIKPRNISDVTVSGNEQPWQAAGYTADDIAELIAAEYDCIVTEHSGDGVEMTYTLKKKGDDTLDEGQKPDYQVTVTLPDGVTKLTDVDVYKDIIKLTALEGAEGTKNFVGSRLVDFTILPEGLIDISKCVVTSKAVYTSQSQKPSYNTIEVVYKNGYDKIVLDPEQFNITVHGMQSGYIDAQTYSNAMTLTGTKKEGTTNTLKFYGSVIADYTIAQRDLADSIYTDDEVEVVLEKHKDMEWTGEDLTNEIQIGDIAGANNLYLYMKVKDNGYRYVLTNVDNTGKYGFDYSYTVEPSPMIDPGEYKVIFTGRGNFCGMREIKINVLKDINLIADGIEVPLQVIPNNVSLAPSELKDIVVKDGDKVLEQGVHYEIIVKDETGNTTFTEESPILINGMYQAIFKGLEPYYFKNNAQEMPVVFEYNHFDTSMDNTEYYNNSTSGYQIVKPVSIHVTSGKNLECQVGDLDMPAVATSKTNATLPGVAEFLLGAENKSYTLKVVGIDDNAFNGCKQLHWVDALALEDYTPTTLSRTSVGPFNGYPLQSLVYLDGDDYTGTNYIYKGSDGDFRCEELKIFDDTQGDQQQVRVGTGSYSWEFQNIYVFTADKVTNTRYFTGGQHYTTCLPYELQMTSDLKAYTLDAASDNIFGFKQYKAEKLDQFTPYVLIPSKSGHLLNNDESTVVYTTPTVNRGFLPLDDRNNRRFDIATPTGHYMYGTNIYMGWTSPNPVIFDLYIMQSKNLWKRIPFKHASTYNHACILPMRAYIMLPSHPQSKVNPPSFTQDDIEGFISAGSYGNSPSRDLMPAKYMDINEDVTGIAEIAEDADWTSAEVYDLQGRKVDTTARLPKGVYIVNGQKRIKK